MVWLIGSKTLLGSEIARRLDESRIEWTGSNSELDVSDVNHLCTYADSLDSSARMTGASVSRGRVPSKIDYVINCFSFYELSSCTKENAQEASENALNIGRTARRMAARLIHFSSSDVFDGKSSSPYLNNSPKSPFSVQGKAFSDAEDFIEKEMTQYYILRFSGLYGFEKENYLHSLFMDFSKYPRIKLPYPAVMNPVSVTDAANAVVKIVESSRKYSSLFGKNSALPYGVYNFGSSAPVTRADFARTFLALCKKYSLISTDNVIEEVPADELPASEQRPENACLDSGVLSSALKLKLPSWEESLNKFVKSGRLPKF